MARGRAEGMALLPRDGAGAWRSFRAMAICLPAFLALRLIGWEGGAPPAGLLTGLVAEVAAYVLAWSLLLLGSLPLAESAGAGARWPRFVAAWNWANVPQYVVLLVAIVAPGLLGLPDWIGQALALAAFGWALWLEWWVAKTALAAGSALAFAVVAADVMIGLVVGGITEKLTGP